MNSQLSILDNAIEVRIAHQPKFDLIHSLLAPVRDFYPNFDEWYNFQFRRNHGSGERVVVEATFNGQLVGVALLKITPEEHKICTLYVHELFRGLSIGERLMQSSVSILGDERVYVSVSDTVHKTLEGMLLRNGFKATPAKIGYYRANTVEHFYIRQPTTDHAKMPLVR